MTSPFPVAAESAAVKYAALDSLAQIKPPYPAQGSADWWALVKRLEELVARDQRKRGVTWTPEQRDRSGRARLAALGDEDGTLAYERNGFTREQWLRKWNPAALEGGTLAPSELLRKIA